MSPSSDVVVHVSPPRPNLLTSIAPRCQGTVGSIVGLVPGVISLSPGESVAGAHQGRHSKSSQYRRMKAEWKSNVYLARSRIQVGHRWRHRGAVEDLGWEMTVVQY